MYRTNCSFFTGYKPCKYQKKDRKLKCNNSCPFYAKKKKVLILKKGAIGEVLRCSVLFNFLKDYEITVLTDYPAMVNEELVQNIYPCQAEYFLIAQKQKYDLLLALDKSKRMCALANTINAKVKKGFYLDENGKIMPFDKDAEYLWKRGVDDEFMKKDTKNYSQLIIETSGFRYTGEEKYIMPEFEKKAFIKTDKKIIGLNTGAGKMWAARIWPYEKWLVLSKKLISQGFEVVLLGGPDEDAKNKKLAKETGASYFGVKDYLEFVSLIDCCDIVVSAVTFAFHVAVGLDKKVVLFNNVFNRNEFNLPNVHIIEPDVPCKMCYKSNFDKDCHVENCMELITVEDVFKKIKELLKNGK
jgi:heptosyltransferase-2